ncbi:MAG: hypothetical protein WKG52_02560 [Variovorax sp.]
MSTGRHCAIRACNFDEKIGHQLSFALFAHCPGPLEEIGDTSHLFEVEAQIAGSVPAFT